MISLTLTCVQMYINFVRLPSFMLIVVLLNEILYALFNCMLVQFVFQLLIEVLTDTILCYFTAVFYVI